MSDPQDLFVHRHIGPRDSDVTAMLRTVGADSLETLMQEVVPEAIGLTDALDSPVAETEAGFLARLKTVAQQNANWRTFIGGGYYGCVTPPVILRNLLENPGWYTPYTPYQAEVAQGRLESLLNFQTVVQDLTAMDVANASLLDEGTAAAEAMTLLHRVQARTRPDANRYLVSNTCFDQTIAILEGRADPLPIEIELVAPESLKERNWSDVFGVFLQTPDTYGNATDLTTIIGHAHGGGALVAVATDLLALTLVKPPGELGADVALGNAQRFGVPMGYRGILCYAGGVCSPNAGAGDWGVGGLGGASSVADGVANTRAAHSARASYVEHLYSTSVTGQYGCDVCRVSRPQWPEGYRDSDSWTSAFVEPLL